MTVKDAVDARKTIIDADDAWTMLRTARTVTTAKGKKVLQFDSVSEVKDEILRQAIGPSGNLRAPTFRVEDEFIIGFNPDLYDDRMK